MPNAHSGGMERDILLVTLGCPPTRGGMQSWLYQRAVLAAERVVVVAPAVRGAREFDARQPFPILRGPALGGGIAGWRRLMQFLFPLWMISSLRRRWRFRMLECGQALPFGLAARLIRSWWGVPYRIWAFGDDIRKPALRVWARPFLDMALRDAERVLSISAYTRGLVGMMEYPQERTEVIYPFLGVPNARNTALPARRGGPILLTVARLEQRKGVHVVLSLIPRLCRRFPNLQYWVVGDGPERRRLEAQAEKLGVADAVRFWGDMPDADLPAVYAASDLFVLLPTPDERDGQVEGFGVVYLEAAAYGVPSVAWHTGGVPEAVQDGMTGVVAPAGDVDAAGEALEQLLGNPGRREEMARAARERAGAMAERTRAQLLQLDAGYG
ncbi:MAG: glycosyltransferase [Anaerolineae bacterium]